MHFLPNQIIALDAFKNEKQINKKFCKEMTEVLAKKSIAFLLLLIATSLWKFLKELILRIKWSIVCRSVEVNPKKSQKTSQNIIWKSFCFCRFRLVIFKRFSACVIQTLRFDYHGRKSMASACSVTNIRTILRTLDKGACIVLTHLDSSPARLPCTLKAARNFFKVDLNCFITRNFEIEENNKLKGQLFLFLETLPEWSAERKENILIAWGHFVLQTS